MLAINSLVATNELQTVRALYLDLIKNVILNTIYEPDTSKENGSHWPKVAHTMIGKKRMENIQFCVEDILKNNVPGDLVETGVWRGGATIFMRAILKAYGDTQRIVWAADSFEGLPRPNANLYPADAQDTHYTIPFLSVSLSDVQANFKSYDLLDNQVCFLKGFFKDSIPNCAISQIAVLRLDGDMYESTIQVLENLYDKVSIGGYIIIDDFTLPGARKATFDFRQARNITDPFINIDGYSTYWKKSK
jgi:hypothetical protein